MFGMAKVLMGHDSRGVADKYGAEFTLQRLKEDLSSTF
jgi:hypothetical protein